MASDCVNFVDEDDAGRILLALLKQVADAARAHADKHFHEVRSRDREERNISLAGNRARQQRFTGSRRSDQQHALRNAPAELLKLLSLSEELNNLAQLFFRLFYASHILECDLLL